MNCIVIRKIGGFYQAFDNDVIIINYLCDYKIVNGKVGFPLSSIDKVVNLLMENKISYSVKEGMKEVDSKDYKKNNKYNKILDKGMKKYSIDYRINSLIDKIKLLEFNDLEELLDLIEDYTNE